VMRTCAWNRETVLLLAGESAAQHPEKAEPGRTLCLVLRIREGVVNASRRETHLPHRFRPTRPGFSTIALKTAGEGKAPAAPLAGL
jgi:hypothetical protein